MNISLILPCKNEAEALEVLLRKLPSCISEVIVVDNGSTDKTPATARRFGARVLTDTRHEKGIGYGYALVTGIKAASGEVIVCMDGDGSYPVEAISKLATELKTKKADFISCNRLPLQNPKKMSGLRMAGVKILNLCTFALFGYPIRDSLTGMWVFRKDIIPYLTLFEGGWNFSLEIKLNAITSSNIKFRESHIPYHDRVFNESKQSIFRTGFEHLTFLFEKRFIGEKRLFLSAAPRISLLEA